MQSGRNSDRPQWLALQELIRSRRVTTVWADRSDRLARDQYALGAFYALCIRSGTAWRFWSESHLDSDSPGSDEIRRRAAFDAEMESRRIGNRLRRHYQHAMANAIPKARRAPLGLRLEGRGEDRRYVIDDRPLAGSLTVAGAARRLVDLYLESGTIWTGVRRWKEELQALEPVLLPEVMDRCQRFNRESVKEWLELTAAELQGHLTRERHERIEAEDGTSKPTYKRMSWPQWELTRDTHPALVEPSTARLVLDQLAANHNRGAATARGKERANPDRMPSFTSITFCGACGHRLGQQSTRAGKGPNGIPYRNLRCSAAREPMGPCSERGISERTLCYELMPKLVGEAERVSALMIGGAPMLTTAAVDPALVEQLEQTRALAISTGLPELRSAVLALESKVAAAAATVRESVEVEQGRKASAQRLAVMLPTLGADCYTMPAVRRAVMSAIERIEVKGAKVVGVTLASG